MIWTRSSTFPTESQVNCSEIPLRVQDRLQTDSTRVNVIPNKQCKTVRDEKECEWSCDAESYIDIQNIAIFFHWLAFLVAMVDVCNAAKRKNRSNEDRLKLKASMAFTWLFWMKLPLFFSALYKFWLKIGCSFYL